MTGWRKKQIDDAMAGDGGYEIGTQEGYEAFVKMRNCKHEWYSAKNQYVLNGSVCVRCGAIDPREPEELKNERTN